MRRCAPPGARLLVLALVLAGCGGAPGVDDWRFLDGNLAGLAESDGGRSVMFSSYDRTGGNDDGFSGLFSRLRVDENGEHVLAEMKGPGCIRRIWMTWPGRSTRMRVYIDGGAEPVLDLPVEELFSGARAPFLAPFAGGDREFGGINFSYVPIPFAKSIRVTTVDPVRFYQIHAHEYPPGTRIESFLFPPERSYLDRLEHARSSLAALPDSVTMEMPWTVERERGDTVLALADTLLSAGGIDDARGEGLRPGIASMEIDRPGVIRELRISIEGASRAGRGVRLYAWWDEETERAGPENASISLPLADLFGSAFAPVRLRSAALLAADGVGALRLPAPFRKARIVLVNTGPAERVPCRIRALFRPSDEPRTGARLHAARAVSDRLPADELDAAAPRLGSRSHTLLRAVGEGVYVGTILSAQGGSSPSFLEGDETVVADGDTIHALHGTGTEDYFNSGWYFAGARAWIPFSGVSFQREDPAPRVSAYRWHLPDPIPFRDSLSFRFEIGDGAVEPGTRYETIALWYQKEPHRPGPDVEAPPDGEEEGGFLPRTVVYPRHMVALAGPGWSSAPAGAQAAQAAEAIGEAAEPELPGRRGPAGLPWGRLAPGWDGDPDPLPLYGGRTGGASGAASRREGPNAPGEVAFEISPPNGLPEGKYDVSLVYARGPGLGRLSAWIEDRKLADRIDCGLDTLFPVALSPPVRMVLGGTILHLKFLAEPASSGARPRRDSLRSGSPLRIASSPAGTAGDRRLAAVVAGVLWKPTEPPIERWLVAGPFDGRPGTRFDTAYAPEAEHEAGGARRDGVYRAIGGKEARWVEARADSAGFVDLRRAIGSGTNRIAYAVTWVRSPRSRAALFSFGSDDGAKVWLNGKLVHRWPVHRAWGADQDRFTGELRAGSNEILVKIDQGIAGWGFSLRVSDARGELASAGPP